MPITPSNQSAVPIHPARSLDLSRRSMRISSRALTRNAARSSGRPDCRRWLNLTDRPVRGLYTASGSRVFSASGRSFYEFFPNQTFLPRGSLITTSAS